MRLRSRLDLNFTDFRLNLDIDIPLQGITAIFGASGSGKTTLLRCLAGLEKVPNALIEIGNSVWQSKNEWVPTHKRNIGFVFQESSLFGHLNVLQNIEYGCRRNPNAFNSKQKQQAIDILGIEHLLNRFPSELSGGQRHRVAIARALFTRPRLLLLDEPLASLDTARKQTICGYLETISDEFRIPMIYVSHSLEEIARLADYMIVIENGVIQQQGLFNEVISSIKQSESLDGDAFSVVFGKVISWDEEKQLTEIRVNNESLWITSRLTTSNHDVRLIVHARDVSLTLEAQENTSILNIIPCKVCEIVESKLLGQVDVNLLAMGQSLVAKISCFSQQKLNLKPGDQVFAQVKALSILV